MHPLLCAQRVGGRNGRHLPLDLVACGAMPSRISGGMDTVVDEPGLMDEYTLIPPGPTVPRRVIDGATRVSARAGSFAMLPCHVAMVMVYRTQWKLQSFELLPLHESELRLADFEEQLTRPRPPRGQLSGGGQSMPQPAAITADRTGATGSPSPRAAAAPTGRPRGRPSKAAMRAAMYGDDTAAPPAAASAGGPSTSVLVASSGAPPMSEEADETIGGNVVKRPRGMNGNVEYEGAVLLFGAFDDDLLDFVLESLPPETLSRLSQARNCVV